MNADSNEMTPKERERAARRRRSLRMAGLGVLIPSAAALIYYAVITPPQFTSETQFTIQSVQRRAMGGDLLSGLGLPAVSGATNDGRIAVDYIRSAAMVKQLRQTSGFDQAYSHFSLDPTAQISGKAPIEKATAFWRRKVKVNYDASGNTVRVAVKANRPEEALRLAQGVLEGSSNVVNSLNSQAQSLTAQTAQRDLQQKQTAYETARDRMANVRGARPLGALDAQTEQAAQMVTQIDTQIARIRVDLAVASTTYQPDSPQVVALRQQLGALQAERNRAAARAMSGPGSAAAAGDLNDRAAQMEYEFAQRAYYSAMEASRQAQSQAESDRRFIVSFVPPQRPESSNYWSRFTNVIAVALASAILLGTALLTFSVVKDHVQ